MNKINKNKINKNKINKNKINKNKINKDDINKDDSNKDDINKDKLNKDKINKDKINKDETLDNSGMTLIELLIAMVITTIVIGMVLLFMFSGSQSYSAGKNEVDIQIEAQMVLNQIEDIMIECDWIESKLVYTPHTNLKTMIFYHHSEITIVFLDTTTNKLYFVDELVEADLTSISTISYSEEENLMSSYVSEIDIPTSLVEMKQKKSAELHITFQIGGIEYKAVRNITFRNQLKEPGSP